MRIDKYASLGLFVCGVISTAYAIAVAVQFGRDSNYAFLEMSTAFFAVSWLVERFRKR